MNVLLQGRGGRVQRNTPWQQCRNIRRRGEKTLISRNPNKMEQFRKEMTNFIFSTSDDLCVSVKSIIKKNKKKKKPWTCLFCYHVNLSHRPDHILIFNVILSSLPLSLLSCASILSPLSSSFTSLLPSSIYKKSFGISMNKSFHIR